MTPLRFVAAALQRLVDRVDPQAGRYRMLFETSPLPMWVLDAETLRFLAVNDAAVRLYGYRREEFLGMTARDIRLPEDHEPFRHFLEAHDGAVQRGVFRQLKKSGEPIDVEGVGHLVSWRGRPARLVFIRDITERQRTQLALERLNRELEYSHERLRALSRRLLEVQEAERGRLARDLHDGLGQMLALLKLQMQRMGRKHEGEAVQRTFDESAEQVAATLDELRRIARDLRPAPMQDRGLSEAVREYAAAMSRRTDLQVDVEGDYAEPMSENVGDELYRITQECLTNCLKHSGARRVVVTLAEGGDRYLLVVADDGRGMSPEAPSGLGLVTIRERAELLGGNCDITASANGGTRVEVSVPR
jgi:PAS domain S-box-containing protein